MLEQLDYQLVPNSIAAEPREVRLGSRDLGRMLVVDRARGLLRDERVLGLDGLLDEGDVLLLNNSKRLPGVLKTRLTSGAQVELRIVELRPNGACTARAYPTHSISVGEVLTTAGGFTLRVEQIEVGPHRLIVATAEADLSEILRQDGLPITSFFYRNYWSLQHYNPIYASNEGSVESPLAGLHFTERLIEKLKHKGVVIAPLTLHVVGSWLPLTHEPTEDERGGAEPYNIPQSTVDAIDRAQDRGRRIIAVGSTSLRAVESSAETTGSVVAGSGVSTLFLQPGSVFNVATGYFTNFHQARSSLIVLDAAFAGIKQVNAAYRHALENGYLFHEFGDAVLYV